jgi:hypothetical protein
MHKNIFDEIACSIRAHFSAFLEDSARSALHAIESTTSLKYLSLDTQACQDYIFNVKSPSIEHLYLNPVGMNIWFSCHCPQLKYLECSHGRSRRGMSPIVRNFHDVLQFIVDFRDFKCYRDTLDFFPRLDIPGNCVIAIKECDFDALTVITLTGSLINL